MPIFDEQLETKVVQATNAIQKLKKEREEQKRREQERQEREEQEQKREEQKRLRLLQLQEQKRQERQEREEQKRQEREEQKRREQEQKLKNATNVIRNLQNKKQRKLIFLVGPTGSGKSKLKETIIQDLKNIGNENYISVDDFFEKDSNSKDIFHTIYHHHFNVVNSNDNNNIKNFIKYISQKINYKNYLGIINTQLENADIKNCVIPQIEKRYGLNNDNELPFSQFTSAVYFALREKYLNKKFDKLIETCINSNKDIIIESNGEHINSIIGWYKKTEDKKEVIADSHDKDHCKSPSLNLRDKVKEKKYEKYVCFLYKPVDEIKESVISRAFKNMNNFLKSKEDNNIPRLPEIEDDILKEKFQKICDVYKKIKDELSITRVYVLYNNENQFERINYYYCEECILWEKNHDPEAEAYYYYNYNTNEATWVLPDDCCCDNKEKPCTNGPCTNNGGRGKKRKKYTQKKQRHFKTRRNYKPKKSRKKNTKKRNRKAKHQ